MLIVDLTAGAAVALVCGLDRVAALQVMISRPIVAAPLAGWLLGDVQVGLQVGLMIELLWLARLPVGAVIPPDDTQVSIAGTVLAIGMGRVLGLDGLAFILLCLLVTIPLGKVGQFFDRFARTRNRSTMEHAEAALDDGNASAAQLWHLSGIFSFALAALATYAVIVAGGVLLVPILAPLLLSGLDHSAGWIRLALPLVGIAVILGTVNVSRALTLFSASFGMAFLLLWLV